MTRQKYFLTSLNYNPVSFIGGILLASVPFKIKQATSAAKVLAYLQHISDLIAEGH